MGSLVDALRLIQDLDRAGVKIELQNIILDAQDRMSEYTQKISELTDQNQLLGKQLNEIKQVEQVRQNLQLDQEQDCYWEVVDQTRVSGPYCPKCLENDGKKLTITARKDEKYGHCRVCKHPALLHPNISMVVRAAARSKYGPAGFISSDQVF